MSVSKNVATQLNQEWSITVSASAPVTIGEIRVMSFFNPSPDFLNVAKHQ